MDPKPFNTGYLDEIDGHLVYYAEFGNPKGEGIVVLHGGPGSKSKPKHIKNYDLKRYRVITFDQRGCGKSTPAGEITHNTLQDLINDIERLRIKLKIEKWFVAGGSWGSTLALAYTQAHPENVKGLLLSSIFLARKRDIEWAFTQTGGISRFFPDLWERRLEFLNKYNAAPENAADVLLKRITEGRPDVINDIAAGISNWEGNLMDALEDLKLISPEDIEDEEIAATKIFLHYEKNNYFLKDGQLLTNLNRIKNIPAIIVHGRYDLLCPAEQAWDVYKSLADAEIIILPSSNHHLTAEGERAKALAFNNFLDRKTKH